MGFVMSQLKGEAFRTGNILLVIYRYCKHFYCQLSGFDLQIACKPRQYLVSGNVFLQILIKKKKS